MQKKLIALAIAGLASSAAFAQSNVTVYGVVDMYYGVGAGTGGTTQTAVNSGGLSTSRLGFKGVEDLGNGLKALFTLEYALAVDADQGTATVNGVNGTNGTGIGAARQQFVGLTGGFGTAVAGRLQTAGYDFAAATNALHGTAINGMDHVSPTAAGAANLISSSARANNAVAYISPSFGGVTIAVNHARLTETATAAASMDGFANLMSATYANGPLTVAGIVANAVVPVGAQATSTANLRQYGIGGAYDFGVATVKASYVSSKPGQYGVGANAVNPANKSDKAWQISGIIPVSAVGKVVLGYAKNTIGSTDTANNAIDNDSSKAYTLAYLHSLSKRTTLYTGYENLRNDKNARLSTPLGTVVAVGDPLTAGRSGNGTSSHTFVVGVNHSF